MEEIIKRLNNIEREFAEYRKFTENVILINTNLVQEIANNIDGKLDILCNNEKPSAASAKSTTKVTKVLTKNAFFKEKLKKNMNEYINELYTDEEIKDLYNHSDVITKKTDLLKKNKIIDLLYLNITKNDPGKNIILKNIYDKYKLDIENEDDNKSETSNT
jgi:hypothetical protein